MSFRNCLFFRGRLIQPMSLMVKFQNTTALFNRAIVARCPALISHEFEPFFLCSGKRGLCRCAVLIVCVCVCE
jgi:hypothetical protein